MKKTEKNTGLFKVFYHVKVETFFSPPNNAVIWNTKFLCSRWELKDHKMSYTDQLKQEFISTETVHSSSREISIWLFTNSIFSKDTFLTTAREQLKYVIID